MLVFRGRKSWGARQPANPQAALQIVAKKPFQASALPGRKRFKVFPPLFVGGDDNELGNELRFLSTPNQ